jgi:hypothetical protein
VRSIICNLHSTYARVNASTISATIPIVKTSSRQLLTPIYGYYAINVSCISSSAGPVANSSGTFVLDNGTTLNRVAPSLAAAINAVLEPDSVVYEDMGFYLTYCNAISPDIEITIGETPCLINPSDLVLSDPGLLTGLCYSGFQPNSWRVGSVKPQILGDVFLNNVLSMFNLDSASVSLSSRPYHPSQGYSLQSLSLESFHCAWRGACGAYIA